MRKGQLTQRQLVEQTRITQQYMSKLVVGLLDQGIVRRGEKVSQGKRGQSGINIEIDPTFLDSFRGSIISDAISVPVIDFAGNVVDQSTHPIKQISRDAVINQLKASLADISIQ